MTGKIIIIEGYEGTGKTTLAQNLVKDMGGIYFHNPKGRSEFTQDMYSLMKKHTSVNEDAKVLMFLANHIININEMNELKEAGHTVICDRSILSTLAYQFLTTERLRELLDCTRVPSLNYDRAIVLTATTDAVLNRIGNRGADNLDQYFISNLEKIKHCYDTYVYDIYNIRTCMQINTSERSPEEVLIISKMFIGI